MCSAGKASGLARKPSSRAGFVRVCMRHQPHGLAGMDAGRERPWAAGPAGNRPGRSLVSFAHMDGVVPHQILISLFFLFFSFSNPLGFRKP